MIYIAGVKFSLNKPKIRPGISNTNFNIPNIGIFAYNTEYEIMQIRKIPSGKMDYKFRSKEFGVVSMEFDTTKDADIYLSRICGLKIQEETWFNDRTD